MHAIRCSIDNVTLPPNARVKVKSKFMLTKWNTMRWHNPNWTGSDPVPAGPNDAFEITDPIDNGDGTFRHVLTVSNDDNNGTSHEALITGLRFGTLNDFDDIDDPALLDAFTDFGSPEPDFVLTPGYSWSVDVVTPTRLRDGGIVVAYDVVDLCTEEVIGQDLTGHEVDDPVCGNDILDEGEECDGTADAACPDRCKRDCTCPPEVPEDGEGTPTVSEWGMVAIVLLLLTGITIKFSRREAEKKAA